jgi:hypothetical protein
MTAIDNAKPGPAHSSAGQTVCQFVAPATARQAAAARHAQGQPDADLLWAGRLGCGGPATAPPAPRWPATTASRATACRYRGEVIIVLAEQTPQLSDALERTTNEGLSHVILDGKIIPVNPGSNKADSIQVIFDHHALRAQNDPIGCRLAGDARQPGSAHIEADIFAGRHPWLSQRVTGFPGRVPGVYREARTRLGVSGPAARGSGASGPGACGGVAGGISG